MITKNHHLFLYTDNLSPETMRMHHTLVDHDLMSLVHVMPAGHEQTKHHLRSNTNMIHIVRFPCLLICKADRTPSLYYIEDLEAGIKALTKIKNQEPKSKK